MKKLIKSIILFIRYKILGKKSSISNSEMINPTAKICKDSDIAVGLIKSKEPPKELKYIKNNSERESTYKEEPEFNCGHYPFAILENVDFRCARCASYYNGKDTPHPFANKRPHPPICMNPKRNLDDTSKCYVLDELD